MIRFFKRIKRETNPHRKSKSMSRLEALKMTETSYLAAATSLLWIALYYFPVGGAILRLALPLPLALLQIRRGRLAGIEGVCLSILLLFALMGPVRGPLILFPYGLLSLWLGWSWLNQKSWWISGSFGVFIGTTGFLFRVLILSVLVGENLWVVITRAGSLLLERIINILNLSIIPNIFQVQLMAILLVILQELIYIFTLHAVAYWIFPRLKARMPNPPRALNAFVSLGPL